MIVLAFDIASTTGYAVGDLNHGIEDSGYFSCKKFRGAYNEFSNLIDLWKPDLICTAKPVRYYNVTRRLSEITGVMLLLAERKGIAVDKDLVDSRCKKVVLGNGKASKDDIKAHFGKESEDEADACMMWSYLKIMTDEQTKV